MFKEPNELRERPDAGLFAGHHTDDPFDVTSATRLAGEVSHGVDVSIPDEAQESLVGAERLYEGALNEAMGGPESRRGTEQETAVTPTCDSSKPHREPH